MDEKKSMSNFMTIIIVIIVIVLAVVLGMYVGKKYISNNGNNNESGENNNQNNGNNNESEENNNQNSGNNNDVNKPDANKGIVYTAHSFKTDNVNLEIPNININSDYAREINNTLEKTKKDMMDKLDENTILYYSYEYYINNNILSLLIKISEGVGSTGERFESYNIDINTGKKVDNASILAIKKLNIYSFYDMLINYIEDDFSMSGSIYNCKKDTMCNLAYNKTLDLYKEEDKDKLLTNNYMFLGREGSINLIGKIYGRSGAVAPDGGPWPYNRIITIDNNMIGEMSARQLESYASVVTALNFKAILNGNPIITDINVIHPQLEAEKKSLVTNPGKVVIDEKKGIVESISGAIVNGFTCEYTEKDGATCTK